MTKPRATYERCPSCGQCSGYLVKQSPGRKTYRCFECGNQWSFWKNKRKETRQ